MSKAKVLNAKDTLSASLAECYAVIDGRRINLMQAKSVKATMKFTSKDVGIMGQTGKAKRSTGWEGSGSMDMYFNSSVFRRIAKHFKDTGEMMYFDMIFVNEDPASSVGCQKIILKECLMEDVVLVASDVDGDVLEESMSFTFNDWEMPEEFKDLDGM